MKHGDAQRLTNVMRKAVEQGTKSASKVDMVMGIVASVDSHHADIYVNGKTDTVSKNFRVPSWVSVSVGDPVLCGIDYGSNLGKMIIEVLPKGTFSQFAISPNTGEWMIAENPELEPETMDPVGNALWEGEDWDDMEHIWEGDDFESANVVWENR